jgi:hypothetical protein
MDKYVISHKIAMMIQNDKEIGMKEGRSAGRKIDSVSIRITDKNNKEYLITVKEL